MVTKTHMLWKQTKVFALCPLRPGVRGWQYIMVKDGGSGHRLRREDRQRTLPSEAVGRAGSLLRFSRWRPTGTSISRAWTTER